MKKYIGFIGVIVNCMLITGLLVHAFTLSSVKDSENDNKKECVYIEKTTTVKEEKEIDPEERRQEDITKNSKVNDSKNYTNNTHNYVEKTTTTKTTYCNDSKNNTINYGQNNNVNDSKNNTINNSQQVNAPQETETKTICGICLEREANPGDVYCSHCREILNDRTKLGE